MQRRSEAKRGSYAELHVRRESLKEAAQSSFAERASMMSDRASMMSTSSLGSRALQPRTSKSEVMRGGSLSRPTPVALDLASSGTLRSDDMASSGSVSSPRSSPMSSARGHQAPLQVSTSSAMPWTTSGEQSQVGPRGEPSGDMEVLEFLEGLLEGFRMAGVGRRPDSHVSHTNDWHELDQLSRLKLGPVHGGSFPQAKDQSAAEVTPKLAVATEAQQASALTEPTAMSARSSTGSEMQVSMLMRRHALKAFLEETCGTVANSFDVMAGLALKASLGASGTPQDRLSSFLGEKEFRASLVSLGYGVGGKDAWWASLFASMDIDGDGGISIQDMYDALVLALPPMPENNAD